MRLKASPGPQRTPCAKGLSTELWVNWMNIVYNDNILLTSKNNLHTTINIICYLKQWLRIYLFIQKNQLPGQSGWWPFYEKIHSVDFDSKMQEVFPQLWLWVGIIIAILSVTLWHYNAPKTGQMGIIIIMPGFPCHHYPERNYDEDDYPCCCCCCCQLFTTKLLFIPIENK